MRQISHPAVTTARKKLSSNLCDRWAELCIFVVYLGKVSERQMLLGSNLPTKDR